MTDTQLNKLETIKDDLLSAKHIVNQASKFIENEKISSEPLNTNNLNHISRLIVNQIIAIEDLNKWQFVEIVHIDKYPGTRRSNPTPYIQKIYDIDDFYTKTYEQLLKIIPNTNKRMQSMMDCQWTPVWLAIAETIIKYDLPLDIDENSYLIHKTTCEIKSAKGTHFE